MKRPAFFFAASLFTLLAFEPCFAQEAPASAPVVAAEEEDLSQLSEEVRAALEDLKAAFKDVNENGETAEKLEKIGDLYLRLGDGQRAIAVFNKQIEQYGGSEELFLKFARVLAVSRRPELALEALSIGSEAFPESEALFFELGKAYVSLGKSYAAISNLKRALEINPKKEIYRYFLADAYRIQNKWDKAVEIIDALIEEKSEYLPVYLMKGDLLLAQGELRDGVRYLEDLLEQHPDSGDVKAVLVHAYQLYSYAESDAGRASRAIRSMRSALEVAPNNVESKVGLASFLNESGEFEEAEALFKETLELRPDFLEAYMLYGKMLEGLSRTADAQAIYLKALAKSRELGVKGAEKSFLSVLGRK